MAPASEVKTRLRNLEPSDPDWLAVALSSWAHTEQFALDGRTITPSRIERILTESVDAQAVCEQDDGPVGLFRLAPPTQIARASLLGVLWRPGASGLPAALESFLKPAADSLQLSKVWLMCSAAFPSLLDAFDQVFSRAGCLSNHKRTSTSDYVDVLLFDTSVEVDDQGTDRATWQP